MSFAASALLKPAQSFIVRRSAGPPLQATDVAVSFVDDRAGCHVSAVARFRR